jgi:L-cysteine desulfidase
MVSELQKIQVTLLSQALCFSSHPSQAATAALPANLQASFKPVQDGIASTISDLSDVIKSDLPVNEKVGKLRLTVQDHVTPVLDTTAARIQDAIRSLTARVDAVAEDGAPQSTEKSDDTPR